MRSMERGLARLSQGGIDDLNDENLMKLLNYILRLLEEQGRD